MIEHWVTVRFDSDCVNSGGVSVWEEIEKEKMGQNEKYYSLSRLLVSFLYERIQFSIMYKTGPIFETNDDEVLITDVR